MINPRVIAVLFHESYSYNKPSYIIREVAREWRREGIKVVFPTGTNTIVDADLLVVHVDLTVIPDEYVQIFERYPCVINGATLDISKRKISTNLVQPGDDYAGEVIVKTNNNCGGRRDYNNRGSSYNDSIDLTQASCMKPGDYPIFESIKSLPPGIFNNPALVVEKFLPERDGDLYCIRSYTFGGSRGWCTLRKSHMPIVKGWGTVERQVVEVHPKIQEMQRQLGFDFGKFDYVMRNGEAILLDVSRTPTYPGGHIKQRTSWVRDFAKRLLKVNPQRKLWARDYAEGILNVYSQRIN